MREHTGELWFIVHPMSGDIEGNSRKVDGINLYYHTKLGIIPVFPSFTWRRYLMDTPTGKTLAEKVNHHYFQWNALKGIILCGPLLSNGGRKEILLALQYRKQIRFSRKFGSARSRRETYQFLALQHCTAKIGFI